MSAVAVERNGAVATLRMDRPERMNAYDFEMGDALLAALGSLTVDPEVRCIVFTGSGKVFSAGGDIVMMSGMKEDTAHRFLELTVRLHAFVASLRRCRKPVISAVNGVAAGAGFPLALAGDMVLATESARFALAYQNIGLSPDGGGTFFLARALGTHRAMELILTGRTLTAGEAASLGLVQRVIPDDFFIAETFALAEKIAAGPTLAFAKAKELYNRALSNPLETQLEEERQGIAELSGTVDFREGVRAFLAKEKANFRGK
ncbi:MAG: enoyl-CoA hydratase/isomerase family protein [Deltaproteobacteria bacterium]|nr:enoyl-CoA hydratase/isomerase family protein [Deltaproteobacteria bacterium]